MSQFIHLLRHAGVACVAVLAIWLAAVDQPAVQPAAAQVGSVCNISFSISPTEAVVPPGGTATFGYSATVSTALVSAVHVDVVVGAAGVSAAAAPATQTIETPFVTSPTSYTVSGSITANVPADAPSGSVFELAGSTAYATCDVPASGGMSSSAAGPALIVRTPQLEPTATPQPTSTAAPPSTATATNPPPPPATASPTTTATATAEPSPTPEPTITATETSLPTATGEPAATATNTSTSPAIATATSSPPPSATASATSSATATMTLPETATSTATEMQAASPTMISTATVSPSRTATIGATATRQNVQGVGDADTPDVEQRLELTQTTRSAPELDDERSWPRLAIGLLGVTLTAAGGYTLWRTRQRPY